MASRICFESPTTTDSTNQTMRKRLVSRRNIFCVVVLTTFFTSGFASEVVPFSALEKRFDEVVRPLMVGYCLKCHDTATQKADFDMDRSGCLVFREERFSRVPEH